MTGDSEPPSPTPTPTPSPSPAYEPKSETPASIDSTDEMNTYLTDKERMTAFKNLRKNERSAAEKVIDKFIEKDRKSSLVSADDRFAMLLKKRDEKIEERVRHGKGSAEGRFPGIYDETEEQDWLRGRYSLYLTGSGRGRADLDDEEEVPKELVIKSDSQAKKEVGAYVKTEMVRRLFQDGGEDFTVKRGRSSRSKSRVEEAYDEEEDEEKLEKPLVGTACRRSYSIHFGCAGLESFKAKMRAEAQASKAGIIVGVAGRRDFGGRQQGGEKRKREDEESEGEGLGEAKKVRLS